MAKSSRVRIWVKVLTREQKREIADRCDEFIAQKLKPRLLPQIRPTDFNYPVDLFGRWRGNKYSFIARYRSGFPENKGEEFDAPLVRLDHVEEKLTDICFDVMWLRHTGRWFPLRQALTLDDALHFIETEEMLHLL